MKFWKAGTELVSVPLRTEDGMDHLISLPQDYWDKLFELDRDRWIPIGEVIDVAWNAVILDRNAGFEREFWQAMAFAIQVFYHRFQTERRGLIQDNFPDTLDSLPGFNR
jgi:hypothetical protein